ncbi:hypothetical protein F4680DRAFT_271001 [Xylaria scruposa]|nr:hypothetical protein F4680DRAFT_271001 [Xylaria scruposa]
MPPNRRRHLDEQQDDVWKENESILRRLYLKEHRTLKDVKKEMESEHGFPTTPLSTYESKLRDLGLRKKMKSKDWRPVYQHYINSGSRHTAIYFNGTRVPWDKAWKEIRRSGARELNGGETTELPADVVMRTPSPVVSQSGYVLRSGRAPAQAPWHLSNEPLDGLSLDAVFRRLTLYDIPSNLLRIEMLSTLEQPSIENCIESNKLSFNRRSLPSSTNESAEHILPHNSTLTTHLTSDIDRLSSALYQLANSGTWVKCVDYPLDKSFNEALDVILNLAPKHHNLSNILESDSPTIRAAIEKMVDISMELRRKDNFGMFIEVIGRYHPEWIPQGRYLVSAGRIGCVKTCHLLLRMTNQPQYTRGYIDDYTTAVLESTARGHVECARILCQHMTKPKTDLSSQENILLGKVFTEFLITAAHENYHSPTDNCNLDFDLRNPSVLKILDWFLEAGANVDAPTSSQVHGIYTRHTPKWWMPTILDVVYTNAELYSRVAVYSVKSRTELTRSGVYRSAKEGIDSLLVYLRLRPSNKPIQQAKLLGIILTEMLLKLGDYTSLHQKVQYQQKLKIIHTLLSYIINLPQLGSGMNVSAILYYVVRAARRHGIIYPVIHYIMETLSCKGAVIVAETIAQAIEPKGTTLLQLLSSYGPDFKIQGGLALCAAISRNNYDAISWLRNRGADINAIINADGEGEAVTILAGAISSKVWPHSHEFDIFGYKVRLEWFESLIPIRYEMLEYLISQNIKLRANPNNTDMRELLYLIIVDGIADEELTKTIEKTRLLLNTETIPDDTSGTQPCLLEACFTLSLTNEHMSTRLVLMELLLDHGISFKGSGVLAILVLNNAPIDIIQRVLNGGADIDTYSDQWKGHSEPGQITPLQAAACVGSLDLAQFLIQRGADVNRPGKGFYGETALQRACSKFPQNIDLIKLLITSGADVNAPPAPQWGRTAFQAAAMDGNFEVALLLLDHGADVNASPSTSGGYCALDGAAYCGKLDMVQFLLQLGALSHYGGESGYKGAIRNAEIRRHSAIVDTIRQHAIKNGRAGEELCADLTQWGDFYSWKSSNCYYVSDESDSEFEDQYY